MTDRPPFRYYGDNTLLAFVRRLLIAFLPAALVVYDLNLVLGLFQSDGGWLADAYGAVRGIKLFETVLPERLNSPGGLIAATLPLGLLIHRKLARRIDAWLFAPFDLQVMEPIRRATGILTWVPSPEAKRIYDELLAWTRDDSRLQALPLHWLLSEPDHGLDPENAPFEPFAVAALLGPNGCGKSQLVRELARALSQRGTLGDPPDGCGFPERVRRLRAALRYWWHRVNPGRAETSDPWDAGMLRSDIAALSALKNWRPRAPSLLVLDDPGHGVCGKVVDALVSTRNHFAFPVRLIVVDQFIPADLPVSPPAPPLVTDWCYGQKVAHRKPFTLFRLPEARFDQAQFRQASAEFWRPVPSRGLVGRMLLEKTRSTDIRALYKREDLQRLIDAYDGAPLLLALAVLWLDRNPSRSVADLLETEPTEAERKLFEHFSDAQSTDGTRVFRLIWHRVKELYDSHHDFHDKLPYAVAAATLAGGLATTEANTKFTLQISRDLPRFGDWNDNHRIAPVSPRPLGKYYAQLVRDTDFRDNPGAFMETIVAAALQTAPGQTLKWLVRAKWLGEERTSWVDSRRADDPDWAFVRWQAYASAALDHMPDMLPRAAQALAGLADAQLDTALQTLERLEHSVAGADPSSLGELRFGIGTRRLLASDHAVEHEVEWLARWVEFSPDVNDDSPAAWITRWADALAQILARRDNSDQLLRTFYPSLRNFRGRQVRRSLARALASEPGVGCNDGTLHCWAALLEVQDEATPITDTAPAVHYPVLPAPPAWSGSEIELWSVMVLNADIRRQVSYSGAKCSIDVLKDEVRQIERIVQPFAHDPLKWHRLHYEWAEAWRQLAYALSQEADQSNACRHAVETVERIVQPFAHDPLKWHGLHEAWATAWRYFAHALAGEPGRHDACRDAVNKVERIVQPFAHDPLKWHSLHHKWASAWRELARALSNKSGESEACRNAVNKVERMVQPFAHDPLKWNRLQLEWAKAWRDLAHALCQEPGKSDACRDAVNTVERIVQPFTDDPLNWHSLHQVRAATWGCLAHALCQEPGKFDACRDAVDTVERIVQPFTNDPLKWHSIHADWAAAWGYLVHSLGQEPGKSDACRDAVNTVERIVQPFAHDPLKWHELHQKRAAAWRHLAYALCQGPAKLNVCRDAVNTVERIVQPFAHDPLKWHSLHYEWAAAWGILAYSLSQESGNSDACRDAVDRVERIVQPFNNDPVTWHALHAFRDAARSLIRESLIRARPCD